MLTGLEVSVFAENLDTGAIASCGPPWDADFLAAPAVDRDVLRQSGVFDVPIVACTGTVRFRAVVQVPGPTAGAPPLSWAEGSVEVTFTPKAKQEMLPLLVTDPLTAQTPATLTDFVDNLTGPAKLQPFRDDGFSLNPELHVMLSPLDSLTVWSGWERFILRWSKGYHLYTELGEEAPAWMLARGRKTRGSRSVWDPRARQYSRRGVLSLPVRHPAYPGLLWLVVSRRGKGHEPWYLLTNELADTPAAMWKVVFAYARRWQIEMSFRFCKTELAMQSPRLWAWENRLKLLLIVSLAYAFLLSLLDPLLKPFRETLLQRFCPRTGKRSRESPTPLYRIRIALDYLCLCTGPPFLGLRESLG